MATSLPKKSVLSRLFTQMLFTSALGTGMMACGNTKPKPEGRRLTTGERMFEESIKDCAIDTVPVRASAQDPSHFGTSTAGTVVADAHSGSLGTHYRMDDVFKYYSEDFSKEESGYWKFRTFVHEMFHIYQFQSVPGWVNMRCSSYGYTLKDGANLFTDYCLEQQAEILADYALFFLHPLHANYNWSPSLQNIARIINIVETAFPKAKDVRLAYTDAKFRQGIADDPSREEMNSFWRGPDKCLKNPSYVGPTPNAIDEGEIAGEIVVHSVEPPAKRKLFLLPDDQTVHKGSVMRRHKDDRRRIKIRSVDL